MSPSSSPGTSRSSSSSNLASIASFTSRNPINLRKSCQSPRLLPAASLVYASKAVLADPFAYADALMYGPDLGCMRLREELAAWLTSVYCPADEAMSVDDVCVTGGASQNLAAICQKFTDPVYTRAVWLVTPSSVHRCGIFEDNGLEGKLRFVPEDEEGIDIGVLEASLEREEALAARAANLKPVYKSSKKYPKIYKHILYCMPSYKNPTSSTMTLARRLALLSLARRFDVLIIADDAFDHLRWGPDSASPPIPRLVDLDRTTAPSASVGGFDFYGNAVSNSSFSTLVAPGCRVGWLQGSSTFVATMAEVGVTRAGGAPGQLIGAFVANLLETGTLQSHLQDVVLPVYQKRHRTLMAAVATYLRPLGVSVAGGGMGGMDGTAAAGASATTGNGGGWFLWLHLPAWCNSDALARRCRDEVNVYIGHDGLYEMGEDAHAHRDTPEAGQTGAAAEKAGYLRICLAWEEEAALEEGVRRVAEVIGKMRGEGKASVRHHIDVRDLLG
ncbi:pyridoxal phosphate-dependent transferase [Geopyxis carbonaria]|nr:pyridoxal phosphate-dependent transferase [Geopyxis carbonaria]